MFGKYYLLDFCDVYCEEVYDNIRLDMYFDMDVFLVCFLVVCFILWENFLNKWIFEI